MSVVVAPVPSQKPWGRALAWLAFLGPFFFASYGLATWVTAQRLNVGAIVFDWERAIPFLPWTIVPYWSIDFLFACSLFTCTDRHELDMHGMRLFTAQVIAVCCFLLFPLTFTFHRPVVDGAFGWLFQALALFDKPFNQAPSLHVALLVIVWAQYARKVTGTAWRALLHAWFALIGVSILTTWQHHFIDVPTGALLGFLCMWLWPQDEPSPIASIELSSDTDRRRLAVRYALGALGAAAVGFGLGGAGLWLLWVSVALSLVAINYALVGPVGFQKRDGRLSPAAAVLFAPYLAAASVNVWLRTRRRAASAPVADGVWIGRLLRRSELERGGFDAVSRASCRSTPVRAPIPTSPFSISRCPTARQSMRQRRRSSGDAWLGACSSAARLAIRAVRPR